VGDGAGVVAIASCLSGIRSEGETSGGGVAVRKPGISRYVTGSSGDE
jgi:hypothetical protein